MRADRRFSESCLTELRAEIADAGGNEVFALGVLDEEGIVVSLRVTARGDEGQVLAHSVFSAERTKSPAPDVFIHNHPSGFLTPSDNDLAIAGKAAESGIGCYIVDNPVEKVYVVAEPVKRRTVKKLKPERILAALREGGEVARRLPSYEPREAQLDLMKLIVRSFNEDAIAAAEAGTGVGKSFAYLLPSLHYALENEERIVISTATITLQQQLFEKDIPLVNSCLSKKVKAVLMKGRGNYVCRRRLDDALREPDLDETERGDLERIAKWVEAGGAGGRSDLSFSPVENLWSRICSEADLCMGMRCPERERCFVLALRKEASDARIIVVNHHLLFADLAARKQGAGYEGTVVLPPYTRVIIDEAHTIETAATSFFSEDFGCLGIFRQLGRLYRKKGASRRGLLIRFCALLPAGSESPLDSAVTRIEAIRKAAEELDDAALECSGSEGVFRLAPGRDNSGAEAALFPLFRTLRKKILALSEAIRNLLEQIDDKGREDAVVWEIQTVLRRLDTIAGICAAFPEYRERQNEVMWFERRRAATGEWAVFTQSPVELSGEFRESLFAPNKTVVCVSATLTVNNAFDYWAGRSGLGLVENRTILQGTFPSPFPYSKAVLLAAPADAPLPEEGSYQDFINSSVGRLAAAAGGSALILFTSYQSLKSAWLAAHSELASLGIRCLKQGDDDRSRLLRAFLDDRSSVLFATDSFWEGVDAPGDTLRLVILCRLPFKSPGDPVFSARCEAVKKRGGSDFMDLSLPDAVMKFKQGFGRLIRRSSDRGVVAVLDGRIIKKRYGSFFLRSLPETGTCFADFESVLRNTERFLYP